MKVEVDKNKVEVKEFNMDELCKLVSKKETTLFKKDNIKVRVSYFWDSHGKLVKWDIDGKHSKTFNGNAEITKLELVRDWKYGGKMNEEYWKLSINGEKINGDVYSYSYYNPETNTINVKMICGWG